MVYVTPDSHLKASCKCFKDAFYLVMFILSLRFDVEIHFRRIAQTLEKWKNISVGISPIFSRLKSASHINHGLPPKSSTT